MSGQPHRPLGGVLPATLGELDRQTQRGGDHADDRAFAREARRFFEQALGTSGGANDHADGDDDCAICRAMAAEGTLVETLELPDGSVVDVHRMPEGWSPLD